MCGIGGFRKFGNEPITRGQVGMMLTDLQRRGLDAAGCCTVTKGKIAVYKKDVVAWQMVQSEEFQEWLEENLTDATEIVLCHARGATQGRPQENENNHPIYAGKAAVVHNGMIGNDHEVFTKLKLERKAEVDSDALRAMVDAYGFTQDFATKLSQVRGSAACAMVHPDYPGQLLLMRYGNPIILASNDNGMLGWASEKDTLYKSMRKYTLRYGFVFQPTRIDFALSVFPNNQLIVINDVGTKILQTSIEMNATYHPPDYDKLHERYGEHRDRFGYTKKALPPAKLDQNNSGRQAVEEAAKKGAPHSVECKNKECGCWVTLTEAERHGDLSLMACESCGTPLEDAVGVREG